MAEEDEIKAIRPALPERRRDPRGHERGTELLRFLEEEVWPKAPPDQLGRTLSRDEEDEILGYGPDGV